MYAEASLYSPNFTQDWLTNPVERVLLLRRCALTTSHREIGRATISNCLAFRPAAYFTESAIRLSRPNDLPNHLKESRARIPEEKSEQEIKSKSGRVVAVCK